jgi:hypothetical protein
MASERYSVKTDIQTNKALCKFSVSVTLLMARYSPDEAR